MSVYRLDHWLTLSNTPLSLLWKRQLRRIIAAERPDVVNGHTPVPFFADMAQRAAGSTPYVLTYHNDIGKDRGILRFIAFLNNQVVMKRTLAGSRAIVATSARYVAESPYLRRRVDRVHLVPPGVDLDRFNSKVQPLGVEGISGERPFIMFVGSLRSSHAHKGVPILLEAFARLPVLERPPALVIVGEGDALPSYRVRARELGILQDVRFLGYVSDADLARYYRAASMLVLPSTDSSEGFGMVLLEAGACGTAVIGSAVGGVPAAIEEGRTGILVPPRDVRALTGAIHRLLQDRDLRERLGVAGEAKVRLNHDWSLLADLYVEVLRSVVDADSSPPAPEPLPDEHDPAR